MIVNKYGNGSGGGVTPEQVEQEIQSALTPYWESGITKEYVDSADTIIYASATSRMDDVEEVVSSALNEFHTQILEVSAATSGKANAVNIQPNIGGKNSFPRWNSQGIITGEEDGGRAYQNTITINGVNKTFWGRGDGNPAPFYAPLSAGSAGEFLVSTGNGAPVWSSVTMPDVSNYVTSAQVETQITDKVSDYWTSAQTQSAIAVASGSLQTQIDTIDTVVSDALNDLNGRFNLLSASTVTSQEIRSIVKIEQSDYDTLVAQSATTPTTFYIIVPDAQ